MGSASSCVYRSTSGAGTKSVKVIDSKGMVQEFLYSVRAAELMVENQGQFVCDSSKLQVGCRVPGLAPADELLQRRLYFLLPTDLLFSVLTEEEMTWLLRRAAGARSGRRKRRKRSRMGLMKTRNDDEQLRVFPAEQIKQVEDKRRRCDNALVIQRLRSWEPALDTIRE